MKFNRFLWDLYLESDRGKETLKEFTDPGVDLFDDELRFVEYPIIAPSGEATDEMLTIDISQVICDHLKDERLTSQQDANRYYVDVLHEDGLTFGIEDELIDQNSQFFFGDQDGDWYDRIAGISVGLYAAYPEFFLPYGFRCRFNQLEEIHAEFGIPLPPVPAKGDKRGRDLYYVAINQSWQEFRKLHGLSAPEMCAFLYDFAPEFTTPLSAEDLPVPSKAWLVSGGAAGPGDFQFVDDADEQTVGRWAANPGVRRGDILVMYLVSPRRQIHSIWRACCDGFIDPFFHYHAQTWICAPIKTKQISFSEISAHPLLSQKSAVRARFQGPSSQTPFTVEEYDAIVKLMEEKGQDISILPRLPASGSLPDIELLNERDVEIHLIEPLIARLGYTEADWIRQMPVKMGRGERNYPDYAFGANTKRGEENAKMLFESKYQLSSHREFTEAFYQAKSYALRLRCKVMATAGKEGVWIFLPTDGNFEVEDFLHKNWGELTHPDSFHEVLSLIGRDKILT